MAEIENSHAHLIVNPAAGGAAGYLDGLIKTTRERGVRVRVLQPGEDARLAALEVVAAGVYTLGIAGGDGSVAAVAGVAVEHGLPLVVVPMGTLNHFARDLGLDLARPLGALDALYAGHERRVDVGRINGRLFINNVSLGVYAEMVGDPGYRHDKLRVAKTKLQAALSDPELRRALRITPPEGASLEDLLAVVVSNNPYDFARWDRLGQRHRLDTGMLHISALDASMLDGLVERLLAGPPTGAIEIRPALRHWMSERLEMGASGERVRVGVDGEPVTLEAPLRFSVEPRALRVLVPEGLPENRQVPPLEAGVHAVRTLRQWLRPAPAAQEGGNDSPHSEMASYIVDPRRPEEKTSGEERPTSRRPEKSGDRSDGRGSMSEQPGQLDRAGAEDEHTWTENIEIAGGELVDLIKGLVAEGNVRRLIIRTPDDEKLLEVPLTTGVAVGGMVTLLAPVLAALGGMATLLARVRVEIVRTEQEDEGETNTQER